jgi:hypothetical protein
MVATAFVTVYAGADAPYVCGRIATPGICSHDG